MTVVQVVGDDFGEVFEDGCDGNGHDLAEPADRCELHGTGKLVEQLAIRVRRSTFCPAREHLHHFLRADATGNALAA